MLYMASFVTSDVGLFASAAATVPRHHLDPRLLLSGSSEPQDVFDS